MRRPCPSPFVAPALAKSLPALQSSHPVHILLIEDDTEAARFLVKGLRESGYTVEHAADGRAGLTQTTSGQFDLVITDRMLPHVDGLTVIEAMRAKGIATPVLVLSAL